MHHFFVTVEEASDLKRGITFEDGTRGTFCIPCICCAVKVQRGRPGKTEFLLVRKKEKRTLSDLNPVQVQCCAFTRQRSGNGCIKKGAGAAITNCLAAYSVGTGFNVVVAAVYLSLSSASYIQLTSVGCWAAPQDVDRRHKVNHVHPKKRTRVHVANPHDLEVYEF